jgi:hypothetical protein
VPDRGGLGYPVASGVESRVPLAVGHAKSYKRGYVVRPRDPD